MRQELGLLIINLRSYAKNLRDLSVYMDLDPDVVAEQIEDIIGGE